MYLLYSILNVGDDSNETNAKDLDYSDDVLETLTVKGRMKSANKEQIRKLSSHRLNLSEKTVVHQVLEQSKLVNRSTSSSRRDREQSIDKSISMTDDLNYMDDELIANSEEAFIDKRGVIRADKVQISEHFSLCEGLIIIIFTCSCKLTNELIL